MPNGVKKVITAVFAPEVIHRFIHFFNINVLTLKSLVYKMKMALE